MFSVVIFSLFIVLWPESGILRVSYKLLFSTLDTQVEKVSFHEILDLTRSHSCDVFTIF